MISKKIMIIGVALLMFSSVFGLIMYIPAPTLMNINNNGNSVSPDIAPGAASTAYLNDTVSYYHDVALPNTATSMVQMPVAENSSWTDIQSNCPSSPWFFCSSSSTEPSSVTSIFLDVYQSSTCSNLLPSEFFYNPANGQSTIQLKTIAFAEQLLTNGLYMVGNIIYVNLTIWFDNIILVNNSVCIGWSDSNP